MRMDSKGPSFAFFEPTRWRHQIWGNEGNGGAWPVAGLLPFESPDKTDALGFDARKFLPAIVLSFPQKRMTKLDATPSRSLPALKPATGTTQVTQ